MKEIKLYLIPQPGSKPEFLASLQVVDPSPAVTTLWNDRLPEQVVLEGYTRDNWAWKPSSAWQTITCASTDGRNKLPGFNGYLKQRTKSAYGRFQHHQSSSSVFVVSYIQSKAAAGDPNRVECRIALDASKIPGYSLTASTTPQAAAAAAAAPTAAPPKPAANTGAAAPPKRKAGLLGNLVGAQQRTNQHVAIASAPARSAVAATATAASGTTNANTNAAQNGGNASAPTEAADGGGAAGAAPLKTAQQVFADFRQSMSDKMLDFDLSSEVVIQIKVSVSEQAAGLADADKGKVAMDVLKYMVYEAAEEVNEEWIAFKEPSEFLDEVIISIYKEGQAPPEVLEEINQGELPEEVRGAQQAIVQERQRQAQYQEQKHLSKVKSEAIRNMGGMANGGEDDEEEEMEALNSKKRDRRTIEDYEREKRKKR
jgi:hypothetical protein